MKEVESMYQNNSLYWQAYVKNRDFKTVKRSWLDYILFS